MKLLNPYNPFNEMFWFTHEMSNNLPILKDTEQVNYLHKQLSKINLTSSSIRAAIAGKMYENENE